MSLPRFKEDGESFFHCFSVYNSDLVDDSFGGVSHSLSQEVGSILVVQCRIRQFNDITLNFDLSVRLQSVLQNLSTSGGPLFPTVDVRHEAQHTINTLYPVQLLERFDV